MSARRTGSIALLVLAALTLAGCGFQLRGHGPLPPVLHTVHVRYSGGYNVLEPKLKDVLVDRLEGRGARIVDNGGEGVTELRLYGVRETQRVLSVGGRGQALEYLMTVSTEFELVRDGEVLVPRTRLGASQDYTYTVTRILSKDVERERIGEALQIDLAERVLRRIDAALDER